MKSKLYAPFLNATCQVLQTMLDLTDITERPAEQFDAQDYLDISVGVTGDLEGTVTYRFPKETSLNVVQILSGMEMNDVDDFVASAVAEIANIISGTVMTLLSADHLTCDILPPVQGKADDSKEYSQRTQCCVSTSAGDICLDIALNKV
ncbi:MAG: chemotaxis protein CheX [Oscillospiraceae bacterium]|jgi:chemotaxis protein CheX